MSCMTKYVRYSGKLSRQKPFTNYEVSWLFPKIFTAKLKCMASFRGTNKHFHKCFPEKIFFSTNLRKFPTIWYHTAVHTSISRMSSSTLWLLFWAAAASSNAPWAVSVTSPSPGSTLSKPSSITVASLRFLSA